MLTIKSVTDYLLQFPPDKHITNIPLQLGDKGVYRIALKDLDAIDNIVNPELTPTPDFNRSDLTEEADKLRKAATTKNLVDTYHKALNLAGRMNEVSRIAEVKAFRDLLKNSGIKENELCRVRFGNKRNKEYIGVFRIEDSLSVFGNLQFYKQDKNGNLSKNASRHYYLDWLSESRELTLENLGIYSISLEPVEDEDDIVVMPDFDALDEVASTANNERNAYMRNHSARLSADDFYWVSTKDELNDCDAWECCVFIDTVWRISYKIFRHGNKDWYYLNQTAYKSGNCVSSQFITGFQVFESAQEAAYEHYCQIFGEGEGQLQ